MQFLGKKLKFSVNSVFKVLFFVCFVAIEILSLIPTSPKIVENTWDKLNHLVAFGTLFITLSLGFPKLKTKQAFIILLLYGIQIEIAQIFCENRYFSLLDIVADIVGIVLGIIIVKFINSYAISSRPRI